MEVKPLTPGALSVTRLRNSLVVTLGANFMGYSSSSLSRWSGSLVNKKYGPDMAYLVCASSSAICHVHHASGHAPHSSHALTAAVHALRTATYRSSGLVLFFALISMAFNFGPCCF